MRPGAKLLTLLTCFHYISLALSLAFSSEVDCVSDFTHSTAQCHSNSDSISNFKLCNGELFSNETDCSYGANYDEDTQSKNKQLLGNYNGITVVPVHKVGPSFWRWLYVREFDPEFTLRLKEKSIDERLSNILHTVITSRMNNIDYHTYNSGDSITDQKLMQLSAGPRVHDADCSIHLEQMLADLNRLARFVQARRDGVQPNGSLDEQHFRLARVLDSFGHFESGYHSGRTHSLGSWEQCQNTQQLLPCGSPDAQRTLIDSRFCWAKLSLSKHLAPSLASQLSYIQESSLNSLKVGICIPASCHTRNFAQNKHLLQQLIVGQFKLPKSVYIDHELELESIFCEPDADSQVLGVPIEGKLLITFLIVWLSLTLTATKFSAECRVEKRQTLWNSLDLVESWHDFMGSKHGAKIKTSAVDLDNLNVVRCAGFIFVIFGHCVLVRGLHSQNYLSNLNVMDTQVFGASLLFGSYVVDTFFAMTGLLCAFTVMKKAKQKKGPNQNRSKLSDDQMEPAQVDDSRNHSATESTHQRLAAQLLLGYLKFVKTRYLRLIPLLVIVHWFKKSTFLYLGSGPLWDYGFNRDTYYGGCREESWLSPLLLTSALLPISRQCLLQAWTVSCDILYAVTLGPIFLIMTKRPKIAACLALGVCLASCLLVFGVVSELEPEDDLLLRDGRPYGTLLFFSKLSFLYTGPQYRAFSIIIGMLAGYVLYHYEESSKTSKPLKWPAWFTGPLTWLAYFYLCLQLTILVKADFFRQTIAPYNLYIFPWFITLGRLFWAASNAVIFMRMLTDWRQHWLISLGTSKFCLALGRLSYAFLLLHYDLLIWDSSINSTHITTRWTILQSFSTVCMISLPLAVLLHVIFENPMDKLAKRYLV